MNVNDGLEEECHTCVKLVPVDGDLITTPIEEAEIITYVETDHILELDSDTAAGEDLKTVIVQDFGTGSII